MEHIDLQAEFSLHGIGISLVNNLEGIEVIYAAISSSGIIWELEQRNRFKIMSNKYTEECEAAYQDWISKNCPEGYASTPNFHINFHNGILSRKSNSIKEKIRRTSQQGLWFKYRQLPHQIQLHMKLNHLQVNNQVTFKQRM